MRTTLQLYGIEPVDLADMSYRDALVAKVNASADRIKRYSKEVRTHDYNSKAFEDASKEYAASVEAKSFNEFLLEELDG